METPVDILPALKREDSRTLGYCGLRRDLFLRCERTSFLVKQVRRWLCQPAGTPISTVASEIRSYFLLLPYVFRSVAKIFTLHIQQLKMDKNSFELFSPLM